MKHHLLNVPRIFAFVVTSLLSTQLVFGQVPAHGSAVEPCGLINGSYRILAQPYKFDDYIGANSDFTFQEASVDGTYGGVSPIRFGQVKFFAVLVGWWDNGVWRMVWGNLLAYYPRLFDNTWQYQNGRWVEVLAAPLTLNQFLNPFTKLLPTFDQPPGYSQVKVAPGVYYYYGWYGWGPIYDHPPNQPQELGSWTSYTWDQWRSVRCGV